jgi:hypothetical protein
MGILTYQPKQHFVPKDLQRLSIVSSFVSHDVGASGTLQERQCRESTSPLQYHLPGNLWETYGKQANPCN